MKVGEIIEVEGEWHTVVRQLKPQVHQCVDPRGQEVIVKQFYYDGYGDKLLDRARHAHQIWQEVRDALMAVGLPDFRITRDRCRVSDYVQGVTLQDATLIHKGLSIKDAHNLSLAATQPLGTLMQHGVSHGDIRPENIIVPLPDSQNYIPYNAAWIIDPEFLVHHSKPAPVIPGTNPRAVFCSIRQISPELSVDNFYQNTSDLFSFGLTLAESVLARRYGTTFDKYFNSYDGFTGYVCMRDRQSGTWRSPDAEKRALEDLKPHADKEGTPEQLRQLVNFIFRCIEQDHKARPQSGEEMTQILTNKGNITEI